MKILTEIYKESFLHEPEERLLKPLEKMYKKGMKKDIALVLKEFYQLARYKDIVYIMASDKNARVRPNNAYSECAIMNLDTAVDECILLGLIRFFYSIEPNMCDNLNMRKLLMSSFKSSFERNICVEGLSQIKWLNKAIMRTYYTPEGNKKIADNTDRYFLLRECLSYCMYIVMQYASYINLTTIHVINGTYDITIRITFNLARYDDREFINIDYLDAYREYGVTHDINVESNNSVVLNVRIT